MIKVIIMKRLIVGETRFEKVLSLALIILLVSSIISIGYWVYLRIYSKYLFLMLSGLIYFSGTLALRIRMITEKEQVKSLAEKNFKRMGISLEEALKYFEGRALTRVYKDWLTLIFTIFIISLVIIIYFPV